MSRVYKQGNYKGMPFSPNIRACPDGWCLDVSIFGGSYIRGSTVYLNW